MNPLSVGNGFRRWSPWFLGRKTRTYLVPATLGGSVISGRCREIKEPPHAFQEDDTSFQCYDDTKMEAAVVKFEVMRFTVRLNYKQAFYHTKETSESDNKLFINVVTKRFLARHGQGVVSMSAVNCSRGI